MKKINFICIIYFISISNLFCKDIDAKVNAEISNNRCTITYTIHNKNKEGIFVILSKWFFLIKDKTNQSYQDYYSPTAKYFGNMILISDTLQGGMGHLAGGFIDNYQPFLLYIPSKKKKKISLSIIDIDSNKIHSFKKFDISTYISYAFEKEIKSIKENFFNKYLKSTTSSKNISLIYHYNQNEQFITHLNSIISPQKTFNILNSMIIKKIELLFEKKIHVFKSFKLKRK